MATNFPTSLDSFTDPTSGQAMNSPSHAANHTSANDAIAALETKVGVNSSAVSTTLDYKVAALQAGTVGGATYTSSWNVSATDLGTEADYNSSSPGTATIPLSLTATVGATVAFRAIGTGALTIAGSGGATVHGNLVTTGQYQTLLARQTATDVWAVTASQSLISPTITTPTIAVINGSGTGGTTLRKTARVLSISSSFGTPTINTDNYDAVHIGISGTGMSAAMTNLTTNLSGTPNDGDLLAIDFLDNGTARALAFGTEFVASAQVGLPTTTVVSTVLRTLWRWDSVTLATPAWVCLAAV